MAGLALLTDNHVRGPLITALRQRGRDVVRAVDLFGQENDDAELFVYAAEEGRVFLTCDEGVQAIAHDWLRRGRTDFKMIYCTMQTTCYAASTCCYSANVWFRALVLSYQAAATQRSPSAA